MAQATSTDIFYPKTYNNNSDLPRDLKEMALSIQDIIDGFIFVPIGSGMDYYGTTAPNNYLFADGSAISRTEYAELFSVIGTTYGAGDGSTTFNLPDKRTRVSVMRNPSDNTFANLGATGGEKTHTLSVNELPSHNHPENAQVWMNANGTETIKYFNRGTTAGNYCNTETDGKRSVQYTKNTGGGQAHNILQPYLVCNYIIKVK